MSNLINTEIMISKKIYDELLQKKDNWKSSTNHIFLIGAEISNKSSMRRKIHNALSGRKDIIIHYPEHIFEDQIFQREFDLLNLENLLAESVHAVVMCVESAGSIAELGAFSNHKKLKDKLIVYLDKQHNRRNSFIKVGPVKYLKNKTSSIIIWHDFFDFDNQDVSKLIKNIKEVKSKTIFKNDLNNPFFVERYLLILLYVLGESDKKSLIEITSHINTNANEKFITVISAALNLLLRKREIRTHYSNYSITPVGVERIKLEMGDSYISKSLDMYRVDMLNLKLRRKK